MTFSKPRRPLAACGLLAIAAVALSACTTDSETPVITDAPSTTSTVRVAAVGADQDARLLSTATVEALAANGLKAKDLTGEQQDGWSVDEALGALKDGNVDVVISGTSALAAKAPSQASGEEQSSVPDDAGSGSASASPSASGTSASGTPSTVRTPPADQAAAVDAASSVLPEGSAVASTALKERRPVMLASKAVASAKELTTVKQAASACSGLSIATPEDWDASWGKVWLTGLGCEPQSTTHPDTSAAVTRDLLLGTVQVGVAESTDPGIADYGLVSLEDPDKALGADPVVGIVHKQTVGQDAIAIINKVTGAAQGDDWLELRRVADPLTEEQRGADVGRWLVARGVLEGNDDGLPKTKAPASAS